MGKARKTKRREWARQQSYPFKSPKRMCYHGKCGHPLIHSSTTGREFIMVRKQGNGLKRPYLVNGDVPARHRKEK